jgi:hypothetical protein
MSDASAGPAESLLRAIADFRDEVNRILDEPVVRLSVRTGDFVAPINVFSAPEPSDESRSRASDPRPRLDALAKHLDLRRRVGSGPAPLEPNQSAAGPSTTSTGSSGR